MTPVDGGRPWRAATTRTVVSIVPLCVLWWLAFTGAVAFYPTLVVGSAAMAACTLWVWRSVGDPPVVPPGAAVGAGTQEPTGAVGIMTLPAAFPQLRITPWQLWLALVVAMVHYLVGAALFSLAARLVPTFAETAAAAYDRAGTGPLWVAVLLGGLISAPMEEVFWRGAVQPVVTGLLVARWPGMRERPLVAVVVGAIVYAAFHAATFELALVAAALLGGLVWGWLLHRTDSLPTVMVAHATWTTLMLLVPPG